MSATGSSTQHTCEFGPTLSVSTMEWLSPALAAMAWRPVRGPATIPGRVHSSESATSRPSAFSSFTPQVYTLPDAVMATVCIPPQAMVATS